MKIVWLDINASYSHSSLALPAIEAQSCNHSNAIEWAVVRGSIKSNIATTVNEVVEHSPEIICYTSWLFTCEIVEKILRRVKALLPDSIIIGGGPEYLGCNEKFLRQNRYIDYIARGEGEELFYRFLDAVEQQNLNPEISGLCYIDSSDTYRDYGTARVSNFEALLPPESSSLFDWEKPFVQIETTRGCFNSCAFCVSGGDKPVRVQSVERITERIERVRQHNIQDIRVLDRTFNHSPKRALEMLELFSKFEGMNFHIELHPALLKSEVSEKIAQLPEGLLHIEAGIQSLDDRVLTLSGRAGDTKHALDGLKMLCELGSIEVHSDLIAGLPHYTLWQIYSDVRTLATIGTEEIQLELLKLLHGTEMRRKASQLGIVYSSDTPYEVLKTTHITPQELKEAMTLSRVLDIYYNNPAWRELFGKVLMAEGDTVKEFVQELVQSGEIEQTPSREGQGLILNRFINTRFTTLKVEFRKAWIRNGLSLKRGIFEIEQLKEYEPTGEEIETVGEWRPTMRCYGFRESRELYIFGFERSLSHSTPLYEAKLCK